MENNARLGGFMLVVGTVGVVVGLVGGVVGAVLVRNFATDARNSLAVTAEALSAAENTVVVAGGALQDLTGTVATVGTAALSVSTSLDSSQVLIEEVARITGEDLPASIEAIDASMPALIRVASVVDTSLRAASFFGLDYDPDEPFDDALRALDASFDGIPDRLRRQSELLDESSDDLTDISATARQLSRDMTGLSGQLAATTDLVTDYQSTARDANLLVARISSDLNGRSRLAQILAVVFGVVFATSQSATLYLGWQLRSGD
ncbi:MAG: hypothetical protein OEO77_02900 [Acidimicrobiia bacterium]|nr:hypothetical protein [Acidimicrobiia bacterium]